MNTENIIAVVTGAGRKGRLGHAIALALAERGANILVHYHSSKEGAEEVAQEIEKLGVRAAICQADMSSASAGEKLIDTAIKELGAPPQILINSGAPFPKDSVSDFEDNRDPVIADHNMDGLTDIGYFDYVEGEVIFRMSQYNVFDTTEYTVPLDFALAASDVKVLTGDFNGDGIPDYMAVRDDGAKEIALSSGLLPDLIVSIIMASGARQTLLTSLPQNMIIPFYLLQSKRLKRSPVLPEAIHMKRSIATKTVFGTQTKENFAVLEQ